MIVKELQSKKKLNVWALVVSQAIFWLLFPVWWQLTDYLHKVVLLVVWVCVTVSVFFIGYVWKKQTIGLKRSYITMGMFVYTIGLLVLLFFRPANQVYGGSVNLLPLRTIAYFLSGEVNSLVAFYNLAANILLFVPYGVMVRLYLKSITRWKLITAPVLVILVIELLQWLLKRGSFDVDDLLLNVMGVYMGYAIKRVVEKVVTIK